MIDMLDENDLKAIESLINKSNGALEKRLRNDIEEGNLRSEKGLQAIIKDAFADFCESIFHPISEQNQEEHQEIKHTIKDLHEELSEYIKDHEKRITELEQATSN